MTVNSSLDGPVGIMQFVEAVLEGADSRIAVHLAHTLDSQISNSEIIVCTDDTDVIVIIQFTRALKFLFRNESTGIWVYWRVFIVMLGNLYL